MYVLYILQLCCHHRLVRSGGNERTLVSGVPYCALCLSDTAIDTVFAGSESGSIKWRFRKASITFWVSYLTMRSDRLVLLFNNCRCLYLSKLWARGRKRLNQFLSGVGSFNHNMPIRTFCNELEIIRTSDITSTLYLKIILPVYPFPAFYCEFQ